MAKSKKKRKKPGHELFNDVSFSFKEDDGTTKRIYVKWDKVIKYLELATLPSHRAKCNWDDADDYEKVVTSIWKDLTNRYFDAAAIRGVHGDSAEEVLDDNIIDITNWWHFDNRGPLEGHAETCDKLRTEILGLSDYEVLLLSIPCFSTGVYKIQNNAYVQWKVLDLDSKNMRYSILLSYYAYEPYTRRFHRTVYGTFGVDRTALCIDETLPHCEYSDVYTQVPYSEFTSSVYEKDFWKNGPVKVSRVTEEETRKEHQGKTVLDDFSTSYIAVTIVFNQLLRHQKPKMSRPEGYKSTSVKASAASQVSSGKRVRKVRSVDGILVSSVKVPHALDEHTVRNYKVASWYTRGCLRHLKSGKVVPVRASVHHRKALKDNMTSEVTKPVYVVE